MTTAVEGVSSAVRRYVASVSGDPGAVPGVFDALAHYVVGGLQADETVLRVACLRNARPNGTTSAALAVLTDRAVLLAEEGVPGQRISLTDLGGVRAVDVDNLPALELFAAGVQHRIVAAPGDGWNHALVRMELDELVTTVTGAADRATASQRAAQPQPVAAPLPTVAPQPAAAPLPSAPPMSTSAFPAQATPPGTHSAALDPQYGQARFVGDAAPVGGIPLSRLFNAVCYIVAGIALVVMSQLAGFPGGGSMALAIVAGLGAIAYGAKIMMTRTSYWVTSWVYVLAIGSVVAMFSFLAK